MKTVTMYTTTVCPYCHKAKNLLQTKGVAIQEIPIDSDPAKADEAVERSGGRLTVPQIFIDDLHVGGCDDLYELEAQGKLDQMLKIS